MSATCASEPPGEIENAPYSVELGKHLLKTKLYVPPVRSIQIARPRLIELLNAGMDRGLILISAPAGYGKTTLVSSWLSETGILSAWLSLDDGDNDPVRFLQYLIAALFPIAPAIADDILEMPQGIQPAQFENLLNLLVNDLASSPLPFYLVLDDFHVIQSETVLKICSYLLDHLPQPMHLAMLTRTDPPLPLSRLRVRNQLLDIRADQLRFTQAEIAAFLDSAAGVNLSDQDISALETRTEGWIAGIQLAALSMRASKDIHGFISAFTGSHHYVMDYLAEEVLKLQPKKVSDFLLQTSILNRLSGPLCQALVEANRSDPHDGQTMLETLEEMNLFVISLDEERHWYRYHHLFADVLRKRLVHQHPQLLSELHRRASQWYEQNEFIAESVEHAIAAGDQDRAAQLIEQNGCFLLMSGEVATLLNWANAVEFQSESHPWLAIQRAWALALIGDLERVEPTLHVPERLLAPLERSVEVRTMLGTIAAARAHCANSKGDTQSAVAYAQQALELLPDCSSIAKSIRSVLVSILGDASWINGNMEEARQAYTEAIRIGREANNLHMVIISNTNIAEILVKMGQLHRAMDAYRQALQIAFRPDGQRSPLAARIFSGMARICYQWNRLDEAEQYLRQCIELSQIWGDLGQQGSALAIQARLEQALNHPEQAREAIRRVEQLTGEQPPSPRGSIVMKADLVRVWLAQGNLERPSERIQKWHLDIHDEIPYQRELEYVLFLRVLLARGDHKPAVILSNRLLQLAEATGQHELVTEVLILQALAFQGDKDTEQALAVLERALTLAQPEGYVRMFLDEGEAMTRLLCQAQSRRVGSGFSAELLSKISDISGMTQPSMQLLIEPLTTREVEVLKLIASGDSNQEIAEKLVISNATVKRHITNIYTKLGVKSRTQAIAIGRELNLFD